MNGERRGTGGTVAPPARVKTRYRGARVPESTLGSDVILRHWREAVPDDRLAHLVKDATRALVRGLQGRLAAHGIAFGHWAFLRILWEGDGLTQRDLSLQAGVMEPTTLAAVRAMERQGLVKRKHLPGNRRKIHIFLTPAGRALKRRLVPLAVQVNEVATAGIPRADVATARRALLAMLENLARDEHARATRAQASRKKNGPRRLAGR